MSEMPFSRTLQLIGNDAFARLQQMRVIIFGVGGVGSWCAEALVRTGVRYLTIVDGDVVCESNVNRQAMATAETIGQSKVEAMKARLLSINPDAEVEAVHNIYNEETAESFCLEDYDVIVDAIDSLADKAQLILHATSIAGKRDTDDKVLNGESGGRLFFFSSMGAARKLDSTRVSVAEFWKVKGCPLARALRNRFKKQKNFPSGKFLCVYSDEQPGEYNGLGSLVHITAVFGFTLAGLVVRGVVGD